MIGDGVSVFGLVANPSSIPVANYTLDGGKTFYSVQMPSIDSPSPSYNWRFLLVSTSSGLQTITITALTANAFYLDYILIQSSTAHIPEKSAIVTPQTSSTSVTSSPSVTTTSSNHGRVLGSGAIAGIVVGIVLGVTLCVILVALVRRGRKTQEGRASQPAKQPPLRCE